MNTHDSIQRFTLISTVILWLISPTTLISKDPLYDENTINYPISEIPGKKPGHFRRFLKNWAPPVIAAAVGATCAYYYYKSNQETKNGTEEESSDEDTTQMEIESVNIGYTPKYKDWIDKLEKEEKLFLNEHRTKEPENIGINYQDSYAFWKGEDGTDYYLVCDGTAGALASWQAAYHLKDHITREKSLSDSFKEYDIWFCKKTYEKVKEEFIKTLDSKEGKRRFLLTMRSNTNKDHKNLCNFLSKHSVDLTSLPKITGDFDSNKEEFIFPGDLYENGQIKKVIDLLKDNIDEILVDHDLNGVFDINYNWRAASTATLIAVSSDKITCANIGDSEALLVKKDDSSEMLTTDHTASDTCKDKNRIENAGGVIKHVEDKGKSWYLVNDKVQYTRMFGRIDLKDLNDISNGIITPVPDVKRVSLNNADFIVIASDGLWNYLNKEEIISFIRTNKEKYKNDIAEELTKYVAGLCTAQEERLMDDITIMIIFFKESQEEFLES